MRPILRLILIAVVILSTFAADANKPEVDFDWLLGHWQRTNEQIGRETFESWKKCSPTHYIGLSYTLEGDKNIWQENMSLMLVDSRWVLAIQMAGEDSSTEFSLRQIGRRYFVIENQYNGFPTSIQYRVEKGNLRAKIAGGDTEIAFDFVR